MNNLFKLLFIVLFILPTSLYAEIQHNPPQPLINLAEQGEAQAQYDLGLFYVREQNYPQAEEWLHKAAQQKHANAQYVLAGIYDLGEGVKQDYHQALQWYKKAAQQGMAEAEFALGVMYHNGQGVRQNKVEAKNYFGKACDHGEQKGCDYYRALNENGAM